MNVQAIRWPLPERLAFRGRSADLEPLGPQHVPELWRAALGAQRSFDYLRYGPFVSESALHDQVLELHGRAGQPVVKPKSSGVAEGWLSLCVVYPDDGAIEIGSIWFAPTMQRTRAATEAIFLLMTYAMSELRYQRLAWRCLEANEASRNAAARYGFVPEGHWRGSAFLKGRRWDQLWYSIMADEWPERHAAIEAWIADANFDEKGSARASLRRRDV